METFLQEARKMYEDLEEWYDDHSEASFGELEEQARQQRRELMGRCLEILINGRDTGFQLKLPQCAVCDTEMDFEGYRKWTIYGLEGDTRLERAYYVCPECEGQGLFPPGPQAEAAP
ncbi:MAG: hypothetical protein GTO63_25980 [Anaerolineae bacterium]|nr:hypothetical protein [Anaerolineae bacterium]NIN98194.1 hypothetical protein [Anaerolineae bacterium]